MSQPRFKGRERASRMNGTEAAYATVLEGLKQAGQVHWYSFEPWKLRLADGAYYKPDFGVMTADGFLECHEVKGFWREAARVRIKVAASLYPFRFVAVQKVPNKDGGGWKYEEF